MPSLSQTVDAADWTMRLEGISAHVLKRFNRNNITTITKKGTPIGIV